MEKKEFFIHWERQSLNEQNEEGLFKITLHENSKISYEPIINYIDSKGLIKFLWNNELTECLRGKANQLVSLNKTFQRMWKVNTSCHTPETGVNTYSISYLTELGCVEKMDNSNMVLGLSKATLPFTINIVEMYNILWTLKKSEDFSHAFYEPDAPLKLHTFKFDDITNVICEEANLFLKDCYKPSEHFIFDD